MPTSDSRISCLGSPAACVATDDLLVTVIVEPDPVPGDNTLRALRSGLNVTMSWVSGANARTYGLYRQARDKTTWPATATWSGLNATTAILPDVPALPDPLYFYRVTAASCSGLEGP